MRIGELANRADCKPETIRYYESKGLLMAPERTSGNYRAYRDSHLEALLFIRQCRGLDLSIIEIRQLLNLREHPEQSCQQLNDLLDIHIKKIEQRVRLLQLLSGQLRTLRAECSEGRAVENCGILKGLVC
jgi:Cd(II)/Pb(II)-responsive transcriptional regulator